MPVSLKIFLTSLAIFDDIGAIVIIALFYTSKISLFALLTAAGCIAVLAFMNFKRVSSKSVYILVGVIMWAATLKSGVHATLAGVLLAMFIPMESSDPTEKSPLKTLEHDLHAMVAFFILPVFAFANAGINFEGVGLNQLTHNVPLGITLGLLVGKQIGIFTFCWLALKSKLATLPNGMSMSRLYGVAALCGIGFTMSLFVGSLAFDDTSGNLLFDERLGILLGSTLSGIAGYLILNVSLDKKA